MIHTDDVTEHGGFGIKIEAQDGHYVPWIRPLRRPAMIVGLGAATEFNFGWCKTVEDALAQAKSAINEGRVK